MRIKKIEISGFGKWVDQFFEVDAQFQVFQGLNESGKSTLRAFIEHLLFGFAKKTGGVYVYEPLSGAVMGGRLWVSDTPFGEVMVERLYRHGKVTFDCRTAEGIPLSEGQWQSLLSHLTVKQYVQVYGFNEDQLHEYQWLTPDEMEHYLYSVSVSGSDAYMKQAQSLKREADKAFTPRASKRPLNQKLKKLEELGNRIEQLAQQNTEYEDLRQQLIQTSEQRQQVADSHQTLAQKQQSLRQLQQLWPTYETYRQQTQDNQNDLLDNWQDDWEEQMEQLHLQEEWVLKEITTTEAHLHQLQIKHSHEQTLYQTDEWQKIVHTTTTQEGIITQTLDQCQSLQRHLTSLQQEMTMEADFWQVSQEALPAPLTGQQIDYLHRIQQQQQAQAREQDEIAAQKQQLSAQLERLRQQFASTPQATTKGFQFQPWIVSLIVAVLVTVVLPQWSLRLIMYGGIVAGTLWWQRQQSRRLGQSELTDYLEAEMTEITHKLNMLTQRQQELATSLSHHEQALQTFYKESAYAKTAVTLDHLLQGDSLAPLRKMKAEQQETKAVLQQANDVLAPIVTLWKWYDAQQVPSAPRDLQTQWRMIRESVNEYLNQQKQQVGHYQEVTQWQTRLLQLKQEHQQVTQAIAHLLETSQTVSEEDFQHHVQQVHSLKEQHQERHRLIRLLGDSLPALQVYENEASLEEDLRQITSTLSQSQDDYQALVRHEATLQERLHRIEQDDTAQETLIAFELLKTEIMEDLQQWSGKQYASQWLIDSLKEQIPTTQAPILETASQYLSRLSLGRYHQVLFHDNRLEVLRQDDRWLTLTYLSRGTCDQLLVAIRLAFIKHLASHTSLPLLVDDGFVNFDSERKQIMVELLEEIATCVQVIYFTLDANEAVPQATVTQLPSPRKKETE